MNFLTKNQKGFLSRFCRYFFCTTLLLTVAVSCKKDADLDPDSGRVIFWSANKAVESIKVDCYVDGKKIGTLSKVTTSTPSCDASGLPVATVKVGEHELEYRAENGQNFSETFTVEAGKCVNFELQ